LNALIGNQQLYAIPQLTSFSSHISTPPSSTGQAH